MTDVSNREEVRTGPDRVRSFLRTTGVVGLAWLPFAVAWTLYARIYVPEISFGAAAVSGLVAMGNAAALGVGVWYLTGVYPWPQKLRPSFYLAHLGLAVLYAALWTVMGQFYGGGIEGVISFFVEAVLLGWRLLMGVWLYGMVVGVCYLIRVGRRLVEQERLLARAEALAMEARLESLRSQLNPHFLFNALHTIRALVNTDPSLAREGIERLGRLLRYSLERSSGAFVSLEEEWRFTEDYLELERVRLGDRLKTTSELAPEARSCLVPPLLVQALVENAVIHGIAPAVDGGTVTVRASISNGDLCLNVEDDGVGADPGRVTDGHGHRLLRERLEGLYGDRASVDFSGAPKAGFGVSVRIPRETVEPPE